VKRDPPADAKEWKVKPAKKHNSRRNRAKAMKIIGNRPFRP